MMIHTITRKYEIIMGHEGETGYRTVAFDVSMFPEDAVVFLDYVRYGEYVPYPINLERKGSVAYWYPNEIDTAFRGTGRGQLVCMRGDELIGKSDVFKLINRFSLSHDEEAPSGYENWLQELERIAASVVSGVDAGKAEIDAEIESGKAEINRTSAEAVESINTAKTEAVNTVNSAKNDGINRLNDRIESGKAEINTAKTDSLDAIESKKEAVHTELDGYVAEHHDELKGEKGDAYVVTEEDLKEIGDRVEAEYEPNLNALKSEVSGKAEAEDLALANRKITKLEQKNDALWKLNQGQTYDFFEQVEDGHNDTPSGGKYMSVEDVRGKTEQDTTQGYNIMPSAEKSTRIEAGISAECDGKGTYNVKGTADDNYTIMFDLKETFTIPTSLGNGGSGCLYLNNEGIGLGFSSLDFYYDENHIENWSFGSGNRVVTVYTSQQGKQVNRVAFRLDGGAGALYDLTVKPMFTNDGSSSHTFEPYTRGIPSPSPEYPQEIKSVENIEFKHTDADGNIVAERTIIPPRPLNKIGDYFDKADIENGVWELKTLEKVFDGSESGWSIDRGGEPLAIFPNSVSTLDVPIIDPLTKGFCNIGVADVRQATQRIGANILPNQTALRVRTKNLDNMNIDDFKDWLSANNLHIVYVTNTVAEPINESDLEFLRSLETLPATDNIFITDNYGRDVSFLVEYVRKLNEV